MKIKDGQFIDDQGRVLNLRGVNLGGSTKVPFTPNGASWNKEGFYNHRNVSFVGRPFPLEQADEHFSRLKAWGFTFLRFLITWEAVEHAGPGIYDREYLDYLRKVIQKADEYGMTVFIDPHQDVWSRFTGGDGAPGWTLEIVGMDLTKLHTAGAAFVHQESGDPYPRMIWPSNYNKLAAASMFTLFFGGRDFAPNLLVDGVNIQDYLQDHYIASVLQVVETLKDLPNVIGYDTLNEPSCGFIGQKSLSDTNINPIKLGDTPTFIQSMMLGSGYPQEVQRYKIGTLGFVKDGKRMVNSERVSIWREGKQDIWREHGVWDVDPNGQVQVLKDDYFSQVAGKPVHFNPDYFKPFARKVITAIRSVDPDAMIFIEEIPNEHDLTWTDADGQNVVCAGHWYDDMTLITKTFREWFSIDVQKMAPVLGRQNVRNMFASHIRGIIDHAAEKMNGIPTVIGEVGTPFDMRNKYAYRTGDETEITRALDATMYALESNFANFTLWNYTADNNNEHGDLWNDEDLSLFSRDQMKGTGLIHDGDRALKAAVRPYPLATGGIPQQMKFDINKREFSYSFKTSDANPAETVLFVPAYQYPAGFRVLVSDGEYTIHPEQQTVVYQPGPTVTNHTIQIFPE